MKMKANGKSGRHFLLLDEQGREAGRLDYTSWLSGRVAVLRAGGKEYKIAPRKTFDTTIRVMENDTLLYSLKHAWAGLRITGNEGRPSYTIRRVGFLKGHYGLFTEQKQEIVKLKQHFELSAWSVRFDIETDDNYPEGNDSVLLMLLVFCVNYMRRASAAVT